MDKLAFFSLIASSSAAVSSLLLLPGLPQQAPFAAAGVISAMFCGAACAVLRQRGALK